MVRRGRRASGEWLKERRQAEERFGYSAEGALTRIHAQCQKLAPGPPLPLPQPALTDGVAPLDVLVGRLLQMLLQMVEGVLCHVGDTQVGVLPAGALSGLRLTAQHLGRGGGGQGGARGVGGGKERGRRNRIRLLAL